MSQPLLTTHFPDVREAFVEAARNGKRCISIDGGRAQPPVKCSGCNKDLEPPRAFAAAVSLEDADAEDDEHKFCVDCRGALLGPPCAGCAKPVRRADGLIALERHWHRSCLRCAHGSCGALLGERHFAHEGLPYCRTHYLELAGEHCAKCGLVVDGGLRALGRVWHDECLRCAETDAPLAPGTAYLHEGRPVAPAARLQTAPRCHACNEPCISNRVYAHGCVYHNDCFRCVHSREVIGDRKFVVFDGEPYLEGHYQKLFGTSAGEAMRTQVHGTHNRYAVCVPLLLSLGNSGLKAFIERHEELMPQVRRVLRESGVQQCTSFVFQPPSVSKPSLMLQFLLPANLDADMALPNLLSQDRIGQQWHQLIDSVHDVGASRGNPWYMSISKEVAGLGSVTVDEE